MRMIIEGQSVETFSCGACCHLVATSIDGSKFNHRHSVIRKQ